MTETLLADVVATTEAVVATRARSTKVAALADLLGRLDADELPVVVAMLSGTARQGRIGVGWRTVAAVEVEPAAEPSLSVLDLDRTLDELAGPDGAGSQTARSDLLHGAPRPGHRRRAGPARAACSSASCATARSRALVTDAVAKAFGVPLAAVRRAAMLAGDLPRVAVIARDEGEDGPRPTSGSRWCRPVQPMLAPDRGRRDRGAGAGHGGQGRRAARAGVGGVEARRRPHPGPPPGRRGRASAPATSTRSPTGCPASSSSSGRCRPPASCSTARRSASARTSCPAAVPGHDERLRPGRGRRRRARACSRGSSTSSTSTATTCIDRPLTERLAALERVAGPWRIPGVITDDAAEAQRVLDEALAHGPRGRDGQGRRVALRGRPPGRGVAQGQAGPHARPRRARRRVGQRAAPGLAVQPPPRRPRPRHRRARDGGQDVQGPDRRAAGLADRAVPGPRDRPRRPRRVAATRAGGRDRPRRRADLDPLPRRRGPALRPRPPLPRRQGTRPRPTPSTPCGR